MHFQYAGLKVSLVIKSGNNCSTRSGTQNFFRWTCAVNIMYELCSFFLQNILLHVCQAAAFRKMHALLIATAFKGYALIAVALCAFHPCNLHLNHFPVCSIRSAVDNVVVSFLQGDLKGLWERREFFFSSNLKGYILLEKKHEIMN